mgnify:CR=1 FL=1
MKGETNMVMMPKPRMVAMARATSEGLALTAGEVAMAAETPHTPQAAPMTPIMDRSMPMTRPMNMMKKIVPNTKVMINRMATPPTLARLWMV